MIRMVAASCHAGAQKLKHAGQIYRFNLVCTQFFQKMQANISSDPGNHLLHDSRGLYPQDESLQQVITSLEKCHC